LAPIDGRSVGTTLTVRYRTEVVRGSLTGSRLALVDRANPAVRATFVAWRRTTQRSVVVSILSG